MKKSQNNKRDFIQLIASMSHNELNDYVKKHSPGVKPVVMCRIIDNKQA
jgi:hypothetical protein